MTNGIKYVVASKIYQGGGILSRHRTLKGAERAIAKEDAAIKRLNRNGGTYYHDCRIEHADTREPIEDSRWA